MPDLQEYIGALEDADQGDLKPLVAMFARLCETTKRIDIAGPRLGTASTTE